MLSLLLVKCIFLLFSGCLCIKNALPDLGIDTTQYSFLLSSAEIDGAVLAVVDFNCDGIQDLIVSNSKTEALSFYVGVSSSDFGQKTKFKKVFELPCENHCVFAYFGDFGFKTKNSNKFTPNYLLLTFQLAENVFETSFYTLTVPSRIPNTQKQSERFLAKKASDLPSISSSSLLLLADVFGRLRIDFIGRNMNSNTLWYFDDKSDSLSQFVLRDSQCILDIFHPSHFIDVNGDEVPEVVLAGRSDASAATGTVDVLEFWTRNVLENGVVSVKEPLVKHSMQRFDVPMNTLKIADFTGNGLNDAICGDTTGNLFIFPNKLRFCKDATDKNCLLRKGSVFESELRSTDIGFCTISTTKQPLWSTRFKAAVTSLRLADINLDGLTDAVATFDDGSFVILINNKGLSMTTLNHPSLGDAYNLRTVQSASFIGLFEEGSSSIDILLNVADSASNSRTNSRSLVYFVRNQSSFDSFFVRLFPIRRQFLTAVPNVECKFLPTIPGFIVKFAVQSLNEGVVSLVASKSLSKTSLQKAPSGFYEFTINFQPDSTDCLSLLPFVSFGLGRMNNFLPFLKVISPATYGTFLSRDTAASTAKEASVVGQNSSCSHVWNSIIPNSKLIVYAPAEKKASWYLLVYFSPVKFFWTVLVAVTCFLLVLGIAALVSKRREMRQDEKEKKESLLLINFDAL